MISEGSSLSIPPETPVATQHAGIAETTGACGWTTAWGVAPWGFRACSLVTTFGGLVTVGAAFSAADPTTRAAVGAFGGGLALGGSFFSCYSGVETVRDFTGPAAFATAAYLKLRGRIKTLDKQNEAMKERLNRFEGLVRQAHETLAQAARQKAVFKEGLDKFLVDVQGSWTQWEGTVKGFDDALAHFQSLGTATDRLLVSMADAQKQGEGIKELTDKVAGVAGDAVELMETGQGLVAGIKDQAGRYVEFSQQFDRLREALQANIREQTAVSGDMAKTVEALNRQTEAVKAIEKAKGVTSVDLKKALADLRKAAEPVANAVSGLQRRIGELNKNIEALTAANKKLVDEQKELEKRCQEALGDDDEGDSGSPTGKGASEIVVEKETSTAVEAETPEEGTVSKLTGFFTSIVTGKGR